MYISMGSVHPFVFIFRLRCCPCPILCGWWLVQERRNSSANALELRLSYTNPSIWRFSMARPCNATLSTYLMYLWRFFSVEVSMVDVLHRHHVASLHLASIHRLTLCEKLRRSSSKTKTLRTSRKFCSKYTLSDIFKCISLKENFWLSNKISLKYVLYGLIGNKPVFVQIMAWHWAWDRPLSEPVMSLLTDAYVRHMASIC